jgi:cytochrome c556
MRLSRPGIVGAVLPPLAAALIVLSSCTSQPTTVTATTTQTVTPPPVTVTATPAANPNLDKLKQLAGPPPSSLDQYFPPKAPAPLYLIEMFNLAGPFEAIGVDLQEGDKANLPGSFQGFKAQYDKVAAMVPEWKQLFPSDPVTQLGQAINAGDPAQIGAAMGKVGEVCSSCHLVNQVKVQQAYHWRNFDDIKVNNPVVKQEQTFPDYMTTMAGGFEGAMVDLQEGQLDQARANFQAFQSEYQTLAKDGCKQCHSDPATNQEIPRKYFTDPDSMALIDQLGQALNAAQPDSTAITNLSGAIGNSICLSCHLIHLPAQTSKDQWDTYSNILK